MGIGILTRYFLYEKKLILEFQGLKKGLFLVQSKEN